MYVYVYRPGQCTKLSTSSSVRSLQSSPDGREKKTQSYTNMATDCSLVRPPVCRLSRWKMCAWELRTDPTPRKRRPAHTHIYAHTSRHLICVHRCYPLTHPYSVHQPATAAPAAALPVCRRPSLRRHGASRLMTPRKRCTTTGQHSIAFLLSVLCRYVLHKSHLQWRESPQRTSTAAQTQTQTQAE